MATTDIEWTATINPNGTVTKGKVWNPVTGCTKVSAGCKHCYAERLANRFWGERKFTDVQCHPERLHQPLKWRNPTKVFVNSMSDLFHPEIDVHFIPHVFAVMAVAKEHTFQILTKRPVLMADFLHDDSIDAFVEAVGESIEDLAREFDPCIAHVADEIFEPGGWPLPNVWLGVSVEDQASADKRIPVLLQTDSAKRFVSCEPLLGPVDISLYLHAWHSTSYDMPPVDWVIVGGESGPGARPMHPDWARSIRDQCQDAGVPFFFKQWGEWLPVAPQYPEGDEDANLDDLDMTAHQVCLGNWGTLYMEEKGLKQVYWCGYQPDPGQNPWFLERVGKKAAGRELDGRTWDEFPNNNNQQ